MTIFFHELKRNKVSLLIWTTVIVLFVLMIVVIFPEMKKEMANLNELFSSMGGFTAAFSMDRLNLGVLIDFYSIEAGTVLCLGGAFYAAMIGVSSLAKEEKDHTADFLLSHPVNRQKVIIEKLLAMMTLIIIMNVIVVVTTALTVLMINETIDWKIFLLLHLSYLLLQLEIGSICFGISAFLRRDSIGLGLGLATALYFFNMVANITEKAEFLKYFTPFAYTEGADIITSGNLDIKYSLIWLTISLVILISGILKYRSKDIL